MARLVRLLVVRVVAALLLRRVPGVVPAWRLLVPGPRVVATLRCLRRLAVSGVITALLRRLPCGG